MSERMIELHRAKLGLGTTPPTPTAASSPKLPSAGSQMTPQQTAKAVMRSEDAQMEIFIDRLQKRDDSLGNVAMPDGAVGATMMGNAETGPTVPTALSRRMLQRQGVGYLDSTVASVVSASADRFLATILQQSIACRDQRLKGAMMAKKAARERKRHLQHYQADVDDRKRRKQEIEQARETVALQAIQVAEAVKKENQSKASAASAAATAAAAAAANGETVKKKKKRPPSASSNPTNGIKVDPVLKKLAQEDEEEEGYDSIDEEEEYYQQQMGGLDDANENGNRRTPQGNDEEDDDDDDDDDEEEEDVTLLLRDIVRPLEAWDFRLIGKETLPTQPEKPNRDFEEDEGNDEMDDKDEESVQQADMDNGNEETMNGIDGAKSFDGEKRPASTTPANRS
jgi:Transcription initiation factor TFIID 23-30kDa subunit